MYGVLAVGVTTGGHVWVSVDTFGGGGGGGTVEGWCV